MKNCCDNEDCKCKSHKRGNYQATQGGSAIYGLGFIGAAIYFIGAAPDFWMGVLGILKAFVWPAFMIYEAFKFLI